ncbi:uncharacterized protein C6orf118 homolog isoform X1 [Dipodomys merriami]|uniref:uncharacterized protein C6orf118 homolog isoform X1 n=1 Tax=Dipodomys merriami TaxID=94247 RepID=UPI0038556F67
MAKDLEPGCHPKWQQNGARSRMGNMTELLDILQRGFQEEVYQYTCGHLNPNRLYRPPEITLQHWNNSSRPRSTPAPRDATSGARRPLCQASEKMRDALAYFTINTALHPDGAQNTRLLRYLPLKGSTSFAAQKDFLTQKILEEVKERRVDFPSTRRREELQLPDMRVLKRRPVTSSRQCATEPPDKDSYHYISTYLAGITKADRYRMLWTFQREVLAKQDLYKSDLRGSKVAQEHEKKLKKELQDVCQCDPLQLSRLHVFGEVFKDICNSSLIFGDLLKEVKDEYELYMAILLVTQPTEECKTLLDQVKGLEKSPVHARDIGKAREELRTLAKATRAALEHNDKLKNDLEMEHLLLQSAKDKMEAFEKDINNEDQLTLTEKVEKRRCEILNMWDKIQDLGKQLKTTLVHTGVSNITESGIKSLVNEATRLETTNRILEKKIQDIESHVKWMIRKSNIPVVEERRLWEFIEDYTTLKEPRQPEEPDWDPPPRGQAGGDEEEDEDRDGTRPAGL